MIGYADLISSGIPSLLRGREGGWGRGAGEDTRVRTPTTICLLRPKESQYISSVLYTPFLAPRRHRTSREPRVGYFCLSFVYPCHYHPPFFPLKYPTPWGCSSAQLRSALKSFP
eukprot:766861-Hanusia_phi.AAC.1